MKKAYNYFLFRQYMFYKDTLKEKGDYTFSTSIASTVLISINLMTIYFILDYNDLIIKIPNKFYLLFFVLLVWIINYYMIVKKETFLNYNFRKDKKGGILIIGYLIVTAVSFICIANLNREKKMNKDVAELVIFQNSNTSTIHKS